MNPLPYPQARQNAVARLAFKLCLGGLALMMALFKVLHLDIWHLAGASVVTLVLPIIAGVSARFLAEDTPEARAAWARAQQQLSTKPKASPFGAIVAVLGVIMTVWFAFFYDVTVPLDSQYGGSVNNIGLMNNRLIGIIIGGFITITGVIIHFGSRMKR